MLIGRYEVLGEIGRGGMGVVLKGRAADGRLVAIKILKMAPTDAARARFDRERRILSAFSEAEGFVPLLEMGDSPKGPYAVMPFVEGGTLRARLDEGALGVEASLALARELAAALARAHERGVIHRDLKPENVLFDDQGRALVADLGLAKHFRGDVTGASQSVQLTIRGAIAGTVGYMAPEQMVDPIGVGPPADVFSLGAMLYECLVGEPAFHGMSPIDLLQKVETCQPVPVRKRRREVPSWLAAVVDRTLAKDPAGRFPDANALARALEGPGAEPATDRRRLVLGVGAAAVAALGIVVIVAALLLHPGAGRHFDVAAVSSRAETPGTRSKEAEEEGAWNRLRASVDRAESSEEKETLVRDFLKASPTSAHAGDARALGEKLARCGWFSEELPMGLRRGPARPVCLWDTGKGLELELVYVPPGDFVMGSEDADSRPRERPRHTHHMAHGFWIGRHDVTWSQYGTFCKSSGRTEPAKPSWWDWLSGDKSNHPVIGVSWNDAKAFCEWAHLSLPREAEWEKAARGTDGLKHPWGNTWDPHRCNFLDASCPASMIVSGDRTLEGWAAMSGGWDQVNDDGFPFTSPVGAFPAGASPWGALDMNGNVQQWCDDWYDDTVYARYAKGADAVPRQQNGARILRGGSWNHTGQGMAVYLRTCAPPDHCHFAIGFRVALAGP